MSRAALGGMAASVAAIASTWSRQRVVVDDRADQADAVCLLGVDPLAQEQQLARLGRSDGAGEHPRAAVVARAADPQERADEHRRSRRVAQVARARERQPRARARARSPRPR